MALYKISEWKKYPKSEKSESKNIKVPTKYQYKKYQK